MSGFMDRMKAWGAKITGQPPPGKAGSSRFHAVQHLPLRLKLFNCSPGSSVFTQLLQYPMCKLY